MWNKMIIYLAVSQAALVGSKDNILPQTAVSALVHNQQTLYDPAPEDAEELVPFSSKEGKNLLIDSEYRENYWSLAENYLTQEIKTYCAVATIVMTLNALGVERPPVERFDNFRLFTQQEFFTPQIKAIKSPEEVIKIGMTLEEVARVFALRDVQSEVIHAEDYAIEDLREIIKKAMNTPKSIVIANYFRKEMGQKGVGHYSPVAAYHEGSDRILVMDVARYKHPPVWVPLKNLYKSMQVIDRQTGKSRGLVITAAPQ